jgi:short-subunit dehydrogenase
MRAAGRGRILLTGSIAGFIPGSYQAVYNGTKAFIDSFSWALRDELKGTGVTVTCLMPGPTDTRFFERAHMLDTKVGVDDGKASAAAVARDGYAALLRGESGVVSGWSNKIQAALAHIMPSALLAQRHRRMAAPGSAPPDR